jgi:predicted nucleic acid-binding protein
MEALACQEIFIRAERDEVLLAWSFMHEDETLLCPFEERKYEVLRLATLCKVRIAPEQAIYTLAKSLHKEGRLSAKDAIHLASALYVQAGFFLTCDDELIRQSRQSRLEISVVNPIDYLLRETDR